MPDTDALARLAYAAFYEALNSAPPACDWTALRPYVQQAWRVVVETVQAWDEMRREEETRG